MIYCFVQDGWGRWQLGFHALFTLAANCPNLKELTISEEHLEVRHMHFRLCVSSMTILVVHTIVSVMQKQQPFHVGKLR